MCCVTLVLVRTVVNHLVVPCAESRSRELYSIGTVESIGSHTTLATTIVILKHV